MSKKKYKKIKLDLPLELINLFKRVAEITNLDMSQVINVALALQLFKDKENLSDGD